MNYLHVFSIFIQWRKHHFPLHSTDAYCELFQINTTWRGKRTKYIFNKDAIKGKFLSLMYGPKLQENMLAWYFFGFHGYSSFLGEGSSSFCLKVLSIVICIIMCMLMLDCDFIINNSFTSTSWELMSTLCVAGYLAACSLRKRHNVGL